MKNYSQKSVSIYCTKRPELISLSECAGSQDISYYHHVISQAVKKGKFLLILECIILTHLKFSELLTFQMNPMPTFLPGFRSAEVSWGLEFVFQILATVDVSRWAFYETISLNLFLLPWYCYPPNSLKIKLTCWTPAARVPSPRLRDLACFAIPSVPKKSSFLLIKKYY